MKYAGDGRRSLPCVQNLRHSSLVLVTSDIWLPLMLSLLSQLLYRLLAGIGVSYAGSRREEAFVSGKGGRGKIRVLPANEERSVRPVRHASRKGESQSVSHSCLIRDVHAVSASFGYYCSVCAMHSGRHTLPFALLPPLPADFTLMVALFSRSVQMLPY